MPKLKNTKDHLLAIAAKQFYENGYAATGVDAIAKAAGITKATLYHYFASKEALIEESLRYLSDFYSSSYERSWNKKGLTSIKKLTILFDEMEGFFNDADFFGCPFINAAGEFTEQDHPARRVCESHYQFLITNLQEFAREAGLKSPKRVGEMIAGIIAGAYSGRCVAGLENAAKNGKRTALLVIKAHQKEKIQ